MSVLASPAVQHVTLREWSGGSNYRDSLEGIALNEGVAGGCYNMTLDEKGTPRKRNDCPLSANLPACPAVSSSAGVLFYSQALNLVILQLGASIYKCAPGGGSWTLFRTATTVKAAAFCDFTGKLVYVHPDDGVRSYDGTTDALVTTSVKGTAIGVWQNKCFVVGDPVNKTRAWWSNAGVLAFTTATDWVDVREKDEAPLTALWPGAGLILFKQKSSYRVNDSTTGSFSTIDWRHGAVGPRSVTAAGSRIVFWGFDGIYAGDGVGPFANVGDKMRPQILTVSVAAMPRITAIVVNNRIFFNDPGTAFTNRIWELHPENGWIVQHLLAGGTPPVLTALGVYTTSTTSADVGLALDSTSDKLYDLFTTSTGADANGAFSGQWQTAYVPVGDGALTRLLSVRVACGVSSDGSPGIVFVDQPESYPDYPSVNVPITSDSSSTGFTIRPMIRGRAFSVYVASPTSASYWVLHSIRFSFVPIETGI